MLISARLRRPLEFHPEEDDSLSDHHADGRSRHTERHADKDGDEDDFDGGAEDLGHFAHEAVVVVMMTVLGGLELDVGRQLDCSVGTTVGEACIVVAFVAFMVMVFVACELVEAFDAEGFHLVGCAFGGCFGFLGAGDEFGEDSAEDIFALGVWGVGGCGDGVYGVKRELVTVSLDFCSSVGWGFAYLAIGFFDSLDLDVVDFDHLAVKAHDGHEDSNKAIFLEFLLVVLYAVAQSQASLEAFHGVILAILLRL